MGGVSELVFVTSQAEEATRDSYTFDSFYNNFTTLLRDLYDSVGASLISSAASIRTKRGIEL
jgi:hypothetical protein